MSYQVFARKYRPTTFADVLGQEHVVRTLRNAIEQDRIAQAYLFAGPRGTGKTSTARILAKALNCPGGPKIDFDPNDPVCIEIAEGRSLDVLEIDGASNNSVDQIRELRDTVKFAPTSGQYKIYYIDEVHMLTTQAFNALLKTLEEPPPHVKFIFATTEPNKVLPTILSRCQRFDLRPISEAIIAKHLLHIAQNEGVVLEPNAAQAVAKGADGGMRDAQSMLDQLVAFCGNTITEQNVLEIFGFSSQETIARLAQCLLERRTAEALELIHAEHTGGRDLGSLLSELIQFFRNLLLVKVSPANALPDLLPETRQRIDQLVNHTTTDRLLEATDNLAEYQNKMRWSADKQLHFELAAIKTIQIFEESSIGDVVRILRDVAGGAPVPAQPVPAPAPATIPAPAATPAAEPALESAPQPTAQPEPAPQPEPTPAPAPEPTPERVPTPAEEVTPAVPSPQAEADAEPPQQPAAEEAPVASAEPTESPEPTLGIEPAPEPAPLLEPEPTPAPEPAASEHVLEAEPTPAAEPESQPTPAEPIAETTPAPSADTPAAGEPTPTPDTDLLGLDLTGDLLAELDKQAEQQQAAAKVEVAPVEDTTPAPDAEPAPEMNTNEEVLAEILRRLDARSEGMVVAAFEGAEVTQFGPEGVTVAFPAEAEFEIDTVVRPSTALKQVVRELNFGDTLKIELSDELQAPEVDLSTPDLSDFMPERPAKEEQPEPVAEEEPPAADEPDPNEPLLIAQMPGFYEDPAIAKLAEEFGLRVVKEAKK
ncbi:DNA polymerase III subunit gamma/tau [Sulfuriroseicoccus oceanibius]|uniref:DNA polymerase III subunit gamma/tau n=1 Tax=Sulfuriroseicoccus oceanibius TaxID=2707525 RepID=A0A7T7JBF3_9BACT|nr:DNA polymerase III subunit gamma/tau [Sulfuriroseicoccus oceanibius]QQL44217.1 DNA polymerase III subunit gamma/tau [Sulfuriroseicoccus oceanibius]